jgi:opacity protein-like surface antigen
MFDWRADRDVTGVLAAPLGGTLSTSIQSSTIMFNAYYDFGRWGSFVPYVGAGVGVARNEMDGVTFSTSPNTQSGDTNWSLALSVMAGAGVQLSERVILDLGYRFIDMGKAQSGTADTSGFTNTPRAGGRPHRPRVQGRPALSFRRPPAWPCALFSPGQAARPGVCRAARAYWAQFALI